MPGALRAAIMHGCWNLKITHFGKELAQAGNSMCITLQMRTLLRLPQECARACMQAIGRSAAARHDVRPGVPPQQFASRRADASGVCSSRKQRSWVLPTQRMMLPGAKSRKIQPPLGRRKLDKTLGAPRHLMCTAIQPSISQ